MIMIKNQLYARVKEIRKKKAKEMNQSYSNAWNITQQIQDMYYY